MIPVSRVKTLTTLEDNQTAVKLSIFQGDSRLVEHNIYLGELEVSVPPRRAGEVEIEVRFTYDINGLLKAEAHVLLADARLSLVIENSPGVLSPEEIKQRLEALSALKVHPRDQQVNSVLMARLERLYQESLGDLRERAGSLAQDYQQALDSPSSAMPASRWLSGWIVSNDVSEAWHET